MVDIRIIGHNSFGPVGALLAAPDFLLRRIIF